VIKNCFACSSSKILEDFPKHRLMKDGRLNICKSCTSLRAKLYRQNPKVVLSMRTYRKNWRLRNPEKAKACRMSWYWQNTNTYLEYNHKRRAMQHKNTVGKVDLDFILIRDCGICHLCNIAINRDDLEFDHIVPIAKGGAHSNDNIAVSHRHCNRTKSAKVA